MTFKNFFAKLFIVLLAGMLPALAMAANANPEGATDWELYVYGNGHVIYEVFTGIKLLMVPDAGETGFRTLLLLLATVGFLVLAVAAGFDPGKNLMKMFSYVFVVWGVIFTSTGLTANVLIVDMVRDQTVVTSNNRVQNAPALVVIPAALTSSIGKYFTEAMETYYSTPDEFKMTGGAVGQFNLFGKMMSEATQYRISSSELKRSLSAYSADCIVPAIALGKFSGPGLNPDTKAPETLYGGQALLNTNNMVATLATAKNKAVLTTYFPYSATDTAWVAVANTEATVDTSALGLSQAMGSGVTVSCDAAWTMIEADLQKHASALLQADATAWERTGTAVPFETVFTRMLERTAAAGGTTSANYSQPQGFILQSAMVNSMRGAFRAAAVHTGNNEVLQAVSLTQAEAQQKSAWSAAFHVFNNMMGYVFTVLQAFIFALTPFIVVALFVPGMGKAIFVNYAQILVWLTLWQPLLSIINFIMVLFGTESLTGVVEAHGGMTMGNDGLLSEKTSDLLTAAGFLGTMMPLLSWGVVKGAMAFTEFISAGVGSAFASQAGAAAATGNLAMGNVSMGNTSMNKYSTMMSSQVGAQAVDVALGAGAMTTKQDLGGSGLMMNAASVQRSQEYSNTLQKSLQESRAIGEALTAMQSQGWSLSQVQDAARGEGYSVAQQKAAQEVMSHMESVSKSSGTGTTMSSSNTAGSTSQVSTSGSSSTALTGAANAKLGASVAGSGLGVGLDKKVNNSQDQDASMNSSAGTTSNMTTSVDLGKTSVQEGHSSQTTVSSSTTSSHTSDARSGASQSESSQLQAAFSSAISENKTITQSLQQMESVSSKFSTSSGMGLEDYKSEMAKLDALQSAMSGGMAGAQATASGYQAEMGARRDTLGAQREAVDSAVGSKLHGSPMGSGAGAGGDLGFGAAKADAQREIQAAGDASRDKMANELKDHLDQKKDNSGYLVQQGGSPNALNLRTPKMPAGHGGVSLEDRGNSLLGGR